MSNIERLSEHPNYDPDAVAAARRLLKDVAEELAVQFKRISIRANAQGFGNNIGIPALNMVGILPYDRERVSAQISNPGNSGATVYVGTKGTVGAGGGFPLYPGKELNISSVGDIYAMASAQVTLGVWVERHGGDE